MEITLNQLLKENPDTIKKCKIVISHLIVFRHIPTVSNEHRSLIDEKIKSINQKIKELYLSIECYKRNRLTFLDLLKRLFRP